MNMLTDFHSHILPGIDDGSADVAESIAMLRMEAEQGIAHVVATPHFYARHDKPQQFLERRNRAELQLRQEMAKHTGLPEISVGAEVFYFRGISDSEFLPQLLIGNGSCVLIEMPLPPWPETVYEELAGIWEKRGILPIIAHVDRYIGPFRTFHIPRRLAQLPVMVQANAEFFLERSTAGMALRMLRADQIQLLGSDCHNMSSRKPNLGDAVSRISQKLGRDPIDKICGYESRVLSR